MVSHDNFTLPISERLRKKSFHLLLLRVRCSDKFGRHLDVCIECSEESNYVE
jgi:hypothetical protein